MSPNNRAKVLFIAQLPPPVHGSATISKVLVESAIINASFNVKVIPMHFSKDMSEIGSFSGNKIRKTLEYALEIFRAVRSFKPDLVYFTLAPIGLSFYRDILFVLILKASKAKIVYHLHVRGIQEESKWRIKKQLYKFVFRNTHIITLSKHLENDLLAVYEGQPFIVNNGIPIVATGSMLAKASPSAPVKLLYLSNFARSKGVFVLLSALSKLHKKGRRFKASIVGKPADVSSEEIERFVSQHELGEVVAVEDAKYGHEKHVAFSNADIFIHPTLNDAFPLVILEAMQFQLPVVSTCEGAIPEIVEHQRTGFLVTKGNDDELCDKIEHLMLNQQVRESMGRAGREKFLSKYTAEAMEVNLRNVLLRIHQMS